MRIGLLSLMRISAFKEISFAAWVPRVGSSYSKVLIFEWVYGGGSSDFEKALCRYLSALSQKFGSVVRLSIPMLNRTAQGTCLDDQSEL